MERPRDRARPGSPSVTERVGAAQGKTDDATARETPPLRGADRDDPVTKEREAIAGAARRGPAGRPV